jgi:hypothetical protein
MNQEDARPTSGAGPSASASADDAAERVRQITLRLGSEFDDVEPDRLEQAVSQAFGSFSSAPVRDFVDVFVERMVRIELRARRAS